MPSNTSTIVNDLQTAFPDISFQEGSDAYWSPTEQTVFFIPVNSDEEANILLHETAHALLGHTDFSSDIALLRLEIEAWQHAKKLARQFKVPVIEELVQDHLESYREWLHARSLCPTCNETGLQTKTSTYQCINCQCSWMVNDARRCQLRRKVLR